MYEILNAHFLTVVIIVGSIMVTPIYVLAVYVDCFSALGFIHGLGLFK
jgi:hypothetical protein